MKRIFILTITLLLMAITVEAKPVSPETAQRVAENFMFQQTGKSVELVKIELPSCLKYIYLFANPKGNGFVYLSSDDCGYPILGYSATSIYSGSISEVELSWLQGYSNDIEMALNCSNIDSSETHVLWESLICGRRIENSGLSSLPINPLLSTEWSGKEYYNSLCPFDIDSGRYTPVGCGAVAMAQVMKYYNWPDTGVGSNSYTSSRYGLLSANFESTAYDWNNMPNYLNSSSTSTQIQAVATLMYHAGVSVSMTYKVDGSSCDPFSDGTIGHKCIENALKNHFRYNKGLHSVYQSSYSDSEWINIIRSELEAGRPVIYRGTNRPQTRNKIEGHIWVCDGVKTIVNYLGFHFNWGWGSEGYFRISATPPFSYSRRCAAIIGIQPDSGTCFGVHHIQSTTSNTAYGTSSIISYSSQSNVGSSGYFNCGDTIRITAMPTDSTRFVMWSDGMIYLSREEIVHGADTFCAIFEPIKGDTLYYDNGWFDFVNRISAGRMTGNNLSPTYWGIKLNPNVLYGHDSLKRIMLYDYLYDSIYSGLCDIYIHIGDTANTSNRVYYQQDTLHTLVNWTTITLSNPVPVNPALPMWLILHTNAPFKPVAPNSGNPNGFMCSHDGNNWYTPNKQYTWMVRGIFSRGDSADITATSYNILDGSVSGGGRYPYGSRVTLTAIPNIGYSFHQWSDGDTSNPRIVYATQNTSLVAYFTQAPNICDTIYIHDTTVVTLHDTTIVHDTTVVSLHDTTIVHDTTMVTLHDTTIVHDTTVVTLHDTTIVHDTTILTMHDTTIVYHLIHDTTYIDIHDTTYLVDTLRETDTIYIFDTIYLHDTVYINNNDIKGVEGVHAMIYQQDGWLVVEGAGGKRVTLYDAVGRILATRMGGEDSDGNVRAPRGKVLFDIPAAGVYLVKVGDLPARKAVVVR